MPERPLRGRMDSGSSIGGIVWQPVESRIPLPCRSVAAPVLTGAAIEWQYFPSAPPIGDGSIHFLRTRKEIVMPRTKRQQRQDKGQRAAIYARVSDKSQDTEDKTSISEQIVEMEAYCEKKGLTITARYQEVGRGGSKNRPEFQRMLADARSGRFDTIVCWKSDRLSRGMYPAAALMEVVEAHQIGLEAVMDTIDLKTFGIMAIVGKIELDNFRERASMGKRGAAKQGRVPTSKLPYGYRIGDDRRPEVVEPEAEIVRRIFHMYLHEGLGTHSIAVQLTDEGIPSPRSKNHWWPSHVHYMLANATYTGIWAYGKTRWTSTEYGPQVHDEPRENWIETPFHHWSIRRPGNGRRS